VELSHEFISVSSVGSEGGNASNMGSRNIEQNTEKKGDLKISSIDFVGLNFSDKKTGRALPAGLVPVSNPFPDDDLPEVEILVGDASKFGEVTSSESKTPSQEEGSDLYKPKISTWGMFPRPNNISKTVCFMLQFIFMNIPPPLAFMYSASNLFRSHFTKLHQIKYTQLF
jgi:hypothetical protein